MSHPEHVSLIRGNLGSFSQLVLHSSVVSINVHCNTIENFRGLEDLPNLKSLDASSNQIQSFRGLQHLTSLHVLNLACNSIKDVHGLGNLVNLISLNLSYNDISTLQGFTEMHGTGYRLETLELHGNQITNERDVISHLHGVLSLRHLVLSQDDTHTNPVCHEDGYRKSVLTGIPQLTSLDHKDRSNQTVTPSADAVLEMLGLNLTLDDLDMSSETPSNGFIPTSPQYFSKSAVKTPNIDAVLSKVKSRSQPKNASESEDTIVQSAISSMECQKDSTTPEATSPYAPEQDNQVNQEARLKYLEEQLANLVAARQERMTTDQPASKMSNGDASEKQSSLTSSPQTRRNRASSLPGLKKTFVKRTLSCDRKHTRAKSRDGRESGDNVHIGIQEKETYLSLVKELETERERRWKSEQAAKKLAQLARDMHSEKAEGKALQDMATQTADRLKEALLRERQMSDRRKRELDACKEKLANTLDEVSKYQKALEEQESAFQTLETAASKTDSDRARMLAMQSKKLHEVEMRLSAVQREVELHKTQNTQLRQRLSELQEILIEREQEHKKITESMFTVDSVEFRNAVSREMNKEEKRHRDDVKMLQQTIATLRTQYSELEDEFRQALHIEANRFQKADTEYRQCSGELERLQVAYRRVKEKEEKSKGIIAELTAVAKEQKIKILELSKHKQEVLQQYKDRIASLEISAEEGRKKGVQLELVKQEKSRLVSQLSAVQSVVDGLRDERKLWGHELAQQGASLAQDRGRMETRIETMQLEITTMQKQNERDLDALKIKSKIVDDQTETIHKMKQALMEKDRAITRVQEESLDLQRKMESDIEDLTQDNAGLNEQIRALLERKKELKSEIADREKELDDLKQSHSKLVKKWAEKGQILSQLETQVRQMKDACDKKEERLVRERDEANAAKRLLTERMERVDTAFREQLETANAAHDAELQRVARNNQNEIEAMKRKVASVEEEMREVLRDADRQKKTMEGKLKRVTSAFKELQEGFGD